METTEQERKDFPKGFRKLSSTEAVVALKCDDLKRELSQLDAIIKRAQDRREDVETLLAAAAKRLPVGLEDYLAIGDGANEGVWVRE